MFIKEELPDDSYTSNISLQPESIDLKYEEEEGHLTSTNADNVNLKTSHALVGFDKPIFKCGICNFFCKSSVGLSNHNRKHATTSLRRFQRLDAGKCKHRWESLRSQHRKYLRNQKPKTGDPGGSQSTWKYSEQMLFLHPHMKDKERISSVVNLEDPIDDTEEILQSNELTTETAFKEMKSPTTNENCRAWKTPQGMKRKSVPAETASSTLMKHLLNEEKKKEEVDEIDLFFDTMKRTVKKFSVADKLLVKRKVFNIVSDIEGKYVGEEQPQRQQSYGQNIQYKNHSLTSFPQTTQENVIFNLTPNTQQQFISSQTSGPQINSYYDDTSNQSTSYSRPSSADSVHSYLSNYNPSPQDN